MNPRIRSDFSAVIVALSFLACSAPPAPQDARDGGDAAADTPTSDIATPCRTDLDCSDSVFCNGVERCMPGATGASARGCIAANPPQACIAGETCDEALDRCTGSCADADHDGHMAMSCGGDDCDDADPNRFPGNQEVCAYNVTAMARAFPNHDEDCNPATISNSSSGDGDFDGDGYVDSACCNPNASGQMNCGNDCRDTASDTGFAGMPWMTSVAPAQIHPTQAEVCNGVDDNCDSQIDEDVTQTFYPDCDGDLFGDAHSAGVAGCYTRQAPQCIGHDAVTNDTDCNDMAATIHTGVPEACDGVDNNCDGSVDEEPAASSACVSSGGATLICMGGVCVVSGCAPNSRDCDGVAGNGCECIGPLNGAPMCTGTACGFGCNTGFHACGTTCADNNSLATCGTSCVACPTTGAQVVAPTCDGTSCGFDCVAGYGDCNHIASDGCETSLQTDPQNCGACGNRCYGFPSSFCNAGVCRSSTGSMTFTSSGTFTVPAGVVRVGVIVVGAGGGGGGAAGTVFYGGGGGGGALCWRNPIPVVAGSVIPVVVGAGGTSLVNGGDSSFNGSVVAQGGRAGVRSTSSLATLGGGPGGTGVGGTCFSGGNGGNDSGGAGHRDPGGGGAAGYSGAGGNGGDATGIDITCSATGGSGGGGGGGGGGTYFMATGGGGGGVGLMGPGANGAAGCALRTLGGGGGSGGTTGATNGGGGGYGGGGSGQGTGAPGAVVVFW